MTKLEGTVRDRIQGSRIRHVASRPVLVALIFGVAATAICASGSQIPSLWGDEAASILSATRPIPSLFRMLGHVDAVVGLYYLGLHGWIDLVGSSPFAVRFPSALAVGAATVAVVLLATKMKGRRVAVAAGVAMCVLPRLTYVGEETRPYALSATFAAFATLVLILMLTNPSRRWPVIYAILLTVGAYFFLYTALIVIPHGLIVLSSRLRRPIWMRWLGAVLAAAAIVSPVAVFGYQERSQIAYLGIIRQLTPSSIFVTPWFGGRWFALVAWALILVALIPVAIAWWRRRRDRQPPAPPTLELVAAAWLLIPSILLIGTQPFVSGFTARYLAFCAPAAAVLIGCGIDRVARVRPVAPAVAAVVVVALAVPVYLGQRGPYAKNNSDWAEVSAILASHASPGQAVLFDGATRASRRPRLGMHLYPAGYRGLHDVALRSPYYRNITWHDTVWPIASPVVATRLRPFRVAWLIDDARGPGTYGTLQMTRFGYRLNTTIHTHSSVIRRYVRVPGR